MSSQGLVSINQCEDIQRVADSHRVLFFSACVNALKALVVRIQMNFASRKFMQDIGNASPVARGAFGVENRHSSNKCCFEKNFFNATSKNTQRAERNLRIKHDFYVSHNQTHKFGKFGTWGLCECQEPGVFALCSDLRTTSKWWPKWPLKFEFFLTAYLTSKKYLK
jgi:hypothetical protein